MQIKKFEASSMAEALQLVKNELGPEAIILSTKNHKRGFGLLSKPSFEVTAAISDKGLAKKSYVEKNLPKDVQETFKNMNSVQQAKVYGRVSASPIKKVQLKNPTKRNEETDENLVELLKSDQNFESRQESKSYGNEKTRPSFSSAASVQETDALTPLIQEIQKLKIMVEELKYEQQSLSKTSFDLALDLDEKLEFESLLLQGFDASFLSKIHKSKERSVSLLEKILKTVEIASSQVELEKIIVFHGPSGSGKSTILANFAQMKKPKKLGIISYSSKADESLKLYARFLQVPFRQAKDADELRKILLEFDHLDSIYIESEDRVDLATKDYKLSKIAVIDPTRKRSELKKIISRYDDDDLGLCVLSKVDEATSFGEALSTIIDSKLSILYLQDSFSVPRRMINPQEEVLRELIG